jgi:hypothetical protein
MKPFDSTIYTIAHRPLHAWVVALADLARRILGSYGVLRRAALGVYKPANKLGES